MSYESRIKHDPDEESVPNWYVVAGVMGFGLILVGVVSSEPLRGLEPDVSDGYVYDPTGCGNLDLVYRHDLPMNLIMAVAAGEETCMLPKEAIAITRAFPDADVKDALLRDGRIAPELIDNAIADMRAKYGEAIEHE